MSFYFTKSRNEIDIGHQSHFSSLFKRVRVNGRAKTTSNF